MYSGRDFSLGQNWIISALKDVRLWLHSGKISKFPQKQISMDRREFKYLIPLGWLTIWSTLPNLKTKREWSVVQGIASSFSSSKLWQLIIISFIKLSRCSILPHENLFRLRQFMMNSFEWMMSVYGALVQNSKSSTSKWLKVRSRMLRRDSPKREVSNITLSISKLFKSTIASSATRKLDDVELALA